MTTQTLHMHGRDRRRYVLRSVDKDAGQGLADELQGTVYESTLQDQISAFHPFAALVIPPLLDAVGVLHPDPKLYVVPNDERLGEFRSLMAGRLVIIEERPDEAIDEGPGFAGSSRIVSTSTVIEELEESPAERLDAHSYLAARFVDLIVGDRDKSENNWLWARFDDDGGHLWKPIPRDRDQAFIELDGFVKKIIRLYEPRLVRFSQNVPNVVGLTRSAWPMDRAFLAGIEKQEWDSILTSVQTALSDTLIDAAVRRLPNEHLADYGPVLAARLKARRDHLPETARQFYRIVFDYADIHASDEPDLAMVEYSGDGRTTVSIYANGVGKLQEQPYFRRTYYAGETKEIRLYLHGDDDVVRVSGGSAEGMTVRVSGGDGQDTVENKSTNELWAYDEGDRTSLIGSPAPRWIRRHAKRPKPWGQTGPLSPDWGQRWLPKFAFPYSTDLGPLVYMGAARIGYGFLQTPHRNLLSFGGGYAPLEQKFVADVEYTVRNLLPSVHGSLRAEYTGIEILHFYGLGNDSKETLSPDFYEVGRELLRVAPGVTLAAGRNVEIDVGLLFEVSNTDDDPDEPNLVAVTNPYGSGTFLQVGTRVAAWFDTRDRKIAPTRGLRVGMWGDAYPGVLDLDGGAIARVSGEVAGYASVTEAGNQTIAVRVGGEKVFGTFPYYESAFLGGPDRLRGFTEERFAGDASVFASGELRLFVGQLNVLLPWHVGVFGFGDVGRVYLDGQSPGGWHTSSGGGIWLAPLYRQFTVSATIARSVEGTFLYLSAGFGI